MTRRLEFGTLRASAVEGNTQVFWFGKGIVGARVTPSEAPGEWDVVAVAADGTVPVTDVFAGTGLTVLQVAVRLAKIRLVAITAYDAPGGLKAWP